MARLLQVGTETPPGSNCAGSFTSNGKDLPCVISFLACSARSSPPLRPLRRTGGDMDLSIIDRAVADYTGSEIGQPGGARLPVDRRMRLSPCNSPLDLSWFGRDHRSIQVACPTAGWRIYVAVACIQFRSGNAGRTRRPAGGVAAKR